MIAWPVLFLIYPLFFTTLFLGLESWKWRIIWAVLFFICFRFPPFHIVYPVVMVIGIPIVNKMTDINQRLG